MKGDGSGDNNRRERKIREIVENLGEDKLKETKINRDIERRE